MGQDHDGQDHDGNEEGSAGQARKTVLYVEDNQANIMVMKGVFSRLMDANLVIANSANKGIAMAEEVRPDLILLDLNLPDKDGFDVFRELRGSRAGADTPIIAVTAAALADHIEQAMTMGFDAYVTKPFIPRELVALINNFFRIQDS